MMHAKDLDSSELTYLLNNCMFNLDILLLLKNTLGQHERMQNIFQKRQNLQLEIALTSVQYQICIVSRIIQIIIAR